MTSAQVTETYGWNIGDTTTIALSTGENIEMRIIGFNHDDKSDGSGKAGITLEMTHCLQTKYPMASSNTCVGGYPVTIMKTQTLPSIKATLPQEWQNAIIAVNKNSANGAMSGYSATLTTSEDLFLLSEIELVSLQGVSYDQFKQEGVIYEYWSDKNRDKNNYIKHLGLGGSENAWWIRSTGLNAECFRYVSKTGGTIQSSTQRVTFTNGSASSSYGVSFAFCV